MDDIYTPPELAQWLISQSRIHPTSIADFAAGGGSLLQAAHSVWPTARLIGSDINPTAVSMLDDALPDTKSIVADFLDDNERDRLTGFGKIDLIVLNPPFSSRGAVKFPVNIGKDVFYGSKALAFVAHSLTFLSDDGEILALIPSSCLTSERDSVLLGVMRSTHLVESLSTHASAFRGRAVSVTGVRISRRDSPVDGAETNELEQTTSANRVSVLRGSTPVWKARERTSSIGKPFLHTTNVCVDSIHEQLMRTVAFGRIASGRTILLPRVGRPSLKKLSLWTLPEVILSDCLFALQGQTVTETDALFFAMKSAWSDIEGEYTGSCAPYITKHRLAAALKRIGYEVDFVVGFEPPATIGDRSSRFSSSGAVSLTVL